MCDIFATGLIYLSSLVYLVSVHPPQVISDQYCYMCPLCLECVYFMCIYTAYYSVLFLYVYY